MQNSGAALVTVPGSESVVSLLAHLSSRPISELLAVHQTIGLSNLHIETKPIAITHSVIKHLTLYFSHDQ